MKIIKFLPFVCLLLLIGCKDYDSDKPVPTNKRTILTYICASNSLSSYLDSDLKEMKEGAKSLGEGQKLIAFIDDDFGSTNRKPQIVEFTKDSMVVVRQFENTVCSTDPEVMKDVMKWVVENYPSESYGLTFWGHGNGWLFFNKNYTSQAKTSRAYGADNSVWINIPTLADVIEESMPHVDFIFFDCCSMQCVEVAYELRNCTDYIISSPAEIPDQGAPYEYTVPDYFYEKDNVGRAIIDDYIEYTDFSQYKASGIPLSVIKTGALEDLAYATQYALTKFMPQYPKEANVDSCIYYYKINCEDGWEIMYDMKNFMRNNLSTSDFSTWNEAFKEAIPYSVYPPYSPFEEPWPTFLKLNFEDFELNDDTYGGMSMYVPLSKYSGIIYHGFLDANSSIKNTEWGKVVDWSVYGW